MILPGRGTGASSLTSARGRGVPVAMPWVPKVSQSSSDGPMGTTLPSSTRPKPPSNETSRTAFLLQSTAGSAGRLGGRRRPPGGLGAGEGGSDLPGPPLQVLAGGLVAGAGRAAPDAHVGEGELLLELGQGGHDPLGVVAEHGRALEAAGIDRVGAGLVAVGGPVAVAVELVGDGRGQLGGPGALGVGADPQVDADDPPQQLGWGGR